MAKEWSLRGKHLLGRSELYGPQEKVSESCWMHIGIRCFVVWLKRLLGTDSQVLFSSTPFFQKIKLLVFLEGRRASWCFWGSVFAPWLVVCRTIANFVICSSLWEGRWSNIASTLSMSLFVLPSIFFYNLCGDFILAGIWLMEMSQILLEWSFGYLPCVSAV